MSKNVKTLFIIIIIFLAVVLAGSVFIFISSNLAYKSLENEIAELETTLENQKKYADNDELLEEIEQLKMQIAEVKEYQENNDKDKIILNYQNAQERYENSFSNYLTFLGIVYTVFVVTSISIPLINRRKLKKIEKRIKKAKKEQEQIQTQLENSKDANKKNALKQEIQTIYDIYYNDRENEAVLEMLIEKIDELLDTCVLEDWERCTNVLYKAHDLHRLEKTEDAQMAYSEGCKYAVKTGNKHFIANSYYKQALFLEQTKRNDMAMESIDMSLLNFPESKVYLRFRRDITIRLFWETNDSTVKSNYKKILLADTKKLLELESKNNVKHLERRRKDVILFTLYEAINANYEETDELDMKWVCEELDKLSSKGSDSREACKVNPEYLKKLPKAKREEYYVKGIAEGLLEDSI